MKTFHSRSTPSTSFSFDSPLDFTVEGDMGMLSPSSPSIRMGESRGPLHFEPESPTVYVASPIVDTLKSVGRGLGLSFSAIDSDSASETAQNQLSHAIHAAADTDSAFVPSRDEKMTNTNDMVILEDSHSATPEPAGVGAFSVPMIRSIAASSHKDTTIASFAPVDALGVSFKLSSLHPGIPPSEESPTTLSRPLPFDGTSSTFHDAGMRQILGYVHEGESEDNGETKRCSTMPGIRNVGRNGKRRTDEDCYPPLFVETRRVLVANLQSNRHLPLKKAKKHSSTVLDSFRKINKKGREEQRSLKVKMIGVKDNVMADQNRTDTNLSPSTANLPFNGFEQEAIDHTSLQSSVMDSLTNDLFSPLNQNESEDVPSQVPDAKYIVFSSANLDNQAAEVLPSTSKLYNGALSQIDSNIFSYPEVNTLPVDVYQDQLISDKRLPDTHGWKRSDFTSSAKEERIVFRNSLEETRRFLTSLTASTPVEADDPVVNSVLTSQVTETPSATDFQKQSLHHLQFSRSLDGQKRAISFASVSESPKRSEARPLTNLFESDANAPSKNFQADRQMPSFDINHLPLPSFQSNPTFDFPDTKHHLPSLGKEDERSNPFEGDIKQGFRKDKNPPGVKDPWLSDRALAVPEIPNADMASVNTTDPLAQLSEPKKNTHLEALVSATAKALTEGPLSRSESEVTLGDDDGRFDDAEEDAEVLPSFDAFTVHGQNTAKNRKHGILAGRSGGSVNTEALKKKKKVHWDDSVLKGAGRESDLIHSVSLAGLPKALASPDISFTRPVNVTSLAFTRRRIAKVKKAELAGLGMDDLNEKASILSEQPSIKAPNLDILSPPTPSPIILRSPLLDGTPQTLDTPIFHDGFPEAPDVSAPPTPVPPASEFVIVRERGNPVKEPGSSTTGSQDRAVLNALIATSVVGAAACLGIFGWMIMFFLRRARRRKELKQINHFSFVSEGARRVEMAAEMKNATSTATHALPSITIHDMGGHKSQCSKETVNHFFATGEKQYAYNPQLQHSLNLWNFTTTQDNLKQSMESQRSRNSDVSSSTKSSTNRSNYSHSVERHNLIRSENKTELSKLSSEETIGFATPPEVPGIAPAADTNAKRGRSDTAKSGNLIKMAVAKLRDTMPGGKSMSEGILPSPIPTAMTLPLLDSNAATSKDSDRIGRPPHQVITITKPPPVLCSAESSAGAKVLNPGPTASAPLPELPILENLVHIEIEGSFDLKRMKETEVRPVSFGVYSLAPSIVTDGFAIGREDSAVIDPLFE
ncbi:hypothetical protein BT69DRAFT_1342716, partial [Atractiella rhizophila]